MEGGGADEVVELGGGGPQEYAAMLKRKLDLYCAAVAKSMEAKPQESSFANLNSQASDPSQLRSQASFDVDGPSRVKTLNVIHTIDVQGKPTNSGSSKENMDDEDDLEGETETVENADPANEKRMKRMLSNRESARRSRKRKQAHLTDIEAQVFQLRADNASLLKRLTDMTQKYNDAAVDSRILKADVETTKTKVKIAEDIVKRVTGTSLLLSGLSDMSTSSMFFTSCVSDAASDAAAPIEDDMCRFFQAPLQHDQRKSHLPDAAILVAGEDMTTGPTTLRRVASLEHLQKRMHGESIQCEPTLALLDLEIPANDKQHQV